MMPRSTLSLTAAQQACLEDHLFPGDGKEAAAVLVCSRVPGARMRLLVRELVLVPHEACATRTAHSLTWPGASIEEAIDIGERDHLSLVLIHSHPNGYPDFSLTDDDSDKEVIPSIFQAYGDLHGSAVMVPGGKIFARLYTDQGAMAPVDLVSVAGAELQFWWWQSRHQPATRPMAFTSAMTADLSGLTACVIGLSGTGSPMAEQACRLGFGRVIGIDHDHVEEKNLNRIINTTLADARVKRPKVDAFADRANRYRDEPYFQPVAADVMTRKAVVAAAQADVIFCCVDSHRGRMIADRLSTAFLLPLFDVGVAIPTRRLDHELAIAEVTGRIDYVYPGGSSLGDRGVYTPETLQAEALAEADPQAHRERVKAGYIADSPEQAPSVIALNMRAASACMMEFIARAFPFRQSPNEAYARTRFMMAEGFEEAQAETDFIARPSRLLAAGGAEPLLGLPILDADEVAE